jgi:hypothetical protein
MAQKEVVNEYKNSGRGCTTPVKCSPVAGFIVKNSCLRVERIEKGLFGMIVPVESQVDK